MTFIERDKPEKITSPRLALAHVTVELGAACECHDLEGYDEAIRETAFAALDLARYRELRDQTDTPDAENELNSCGARLAEANTAYLSSNYQGARRALALASAHLDRYLQDLGPQFADLREDLLPLITGPGSEGPQH
jgi:hypothetical protein